MIESILKEQFHFDSFRPGQVELITAILDSKEVLGILPTGAGKSLCYQLPAYLSSGTTIIITPLVSLIEDQVASIKRRGEKRVLALNSQLNWQEKEQVLQQLAYYRFVFLSPEMLLQPKVQQAFQSIEVQRVVIDEAHCITEWGYDFRPEYLQIPLFLKRVPEASIVALTATATPKMEQEIQSLLGMKEAYVYRQSVNRPMIEIRKQFIETKQRKTEELIQHVQTSQAPGIIYTATRKRAEELTRELIEKGLAVAAYHAGLERHDRSFIQQQFQRDELHWICATTAFGMGIDKSNIRQVLHDEPPRSIAHYVQEIGRAGRDGKKAMSLLFYTPEDLERLWYFASLPRFDSQLIEDYYAVSTKGNWSLNETDQAVLSYYYQTFSLEETQQRLKELDRKKKQSTEKMFEFIQSGNCLREQIMEYFGEKGRVTQENCCSECSLIFSNWIYEEEIVPSKRHLEGWRTRLARLLS